MVATRHEYAIAKRAAMGIGQDQPDEAVIGPWIEIYELSGYRPPAFVFHDSPQVWGSVPEDLDLKLRQDIFEPSYQSKVTIQFLAQPVLDTVQVRQLLPSDSDPGIAAARNRTVIRREESSPQSERLIHDVMGTFMSQRDNLGALLNWPAIARLTHLRSSPNYQNDEPCRRGVDGWLARLTSVYAARCTHDEVHILRWPREAHLDVNGELHNPNGAALRFADGRGIFAMHGQELPAWARNPQDRRELSVAELVTIEDLDLREVLCAERGWAAIADTLGCVVVEDGRDRSWGRLVDVWLPWAQRRFLDAQCGTGRRVLLPVSLDIRTVNDAQEALHGGTPFWMLRAAAARRT